MFGFRMVVDEVAVVKVAVAVEALEYTFVDVSGGETSDDLFVAFHSLLRHSRHLRDVSVLVGVVVVGGIVAAVVFDCDCSAAGAATFIAVKVVGDYGDAAAAVGGPYGDVAGDS